MRRLLLTFVLLVPANTYCLDATERVSSGATAECSGWGATVAEASPPDPRQCETGRSGMAFESGSKNQTVWSRAEKVGTYCLERDGSTGRIAEGREGRIAASGVQAGSHNGDIASPNAEESAEVPGADQGNAGDGIPAARVANRASVSTPAALKLGRPVEPSVSTPLLVYTASAGLDYWSTRYAMSQGARERNPLIGQSHARLIALKALQAGALTYLDVKLQRNHPGKAKALRIGAAVVGAGLAVHNFNVARRQR